MTVNNAPYIYLLQHMFLHYFCEWLYKNSYIRIFCRFVW